ncbi:MAG: ATP-binding cassette domain-containing protein [Lachnospiraceae bacterium]|nr:ATP-binding cassette domain-containing protein [Candidatus Equihabitans merdae]
MTPKEQERQASKQAENEATSQFSNTSREVAVRLTGIKKQYRLGAIGGTTLREELQSWWAKVRGKEDPNVRIGVDQRLIGKKFMALNGLDLTIYKGDRIGIIGANGAGKSTMLKLLSRVTAPTEGEIDIYGRVSSMLEVGTGFHGEMTGRENIYMNGAILGMTKAEIDAKIEDIIDFSEVRDFIDTPVKRYSSGMFVKLAFSVAAHLNSEILIMDEVLAVGDMAFQKKCLEKMRQTADEDGRTILYVSHHMDTIRKLCDRCIVLDQGKMIYDGDVEQAIAIYMDHSLSDNAVDMDLENASHTGRGIEVGLVMKHLTLVDKLDNHYEENEPLKLRVTVDVTKPLTNVAFRLTLRTESDTGLGTVWTKPRNFDAPGEYVLDYEIPMDMIAKGVFYGSIGFYQEKDLGMKAMLDHVTRAFKIELVGSPIWYTEAFGYIKLKENE